MARITTTITATPFTAGTTDDYVIYDGNAGAAGITGNTGADLIYGLAGNDSLIGGAGADTIYGGEGADSIDGGAAADALYGEAGNDTLTGGAGNDTFYFGLNQNSDTVTDYTAGDVVKVDGNLSSLTFGGAASANPTIAFGGTTVTLTGAANAAVNVAANDKNFNLYVANGAGLTGTTATDYLLADGAVSGVLDGKGGADTIKGAGGADTIVYYSDLASVDGGAGNDELDASATTSGVTINLYDTKYSNIEAVTGTNYNDILRGTTAGSETLDGGSGFDQLWGNAGADSLFGGTGNDTYWWGAGDGHDTLDAVTEADVYKFNSLALADLSFAYNGDLTISTGTGGTDDLTITTFAAADQAVNVFQTTDKTFHVSAASAGGALDGTTGIDYVMANAAGNTIDSKGGADTVKGAAGADSIKYYADLASVNGAAGNDTLTAAAATAGVTLDLRETKYANIEVLTGSAYADILRGSTAGSETLDGGAGADNIWGNAGADTLTGGAGADTYWFGTGDGADVTTAAAEADVYNFYDKTLSNLSFADAAGNLVVTVTSGTDTLTINTFNPAAQAANIFQTTDKTFKLYADDAAAGGGVTIAGSTSADYIRNFSATGDTLGGAGGADTVIGGAGTDTVTFAADLASVDGGAGTDTLTAAAATAGATLDLRETKYTNIEALTGSAYADILRGTSGNEALDGGAEADNLWGNTGNDTMTGGAGADTYWFGLGDGTDSITADAASNSLDTVNLYNINTGALIASQGISGTDLVISFTDGSNLVLSGWGAAAEDQRVNKFQFGTSGTWALNSTGTTWSRVG